MKKRPEGTPTSLARVIWGKLEIIGKELADLERIEAWDDVLDMVPIALESSTRAFIVKLAWHQRADFERRVVKKMQGCPYRLLQLAKSPPNEVCGARRQLCLSLLGTDDAQLHVTTRKVKTVFHEAITHCSATGKLSGAAGALWGIMWMVAVTWKGDQQEIEGINNVLQHVLTQAPNCSLPLVDARVAIRKALGMGSRTERDAKWSEKRSRASIVLNVATDHREHMHEVLADPDRFESAKPLTDGPPVPLESIYGKPDALAMEWCRVFNNRWRRAIKTIAEDTALHFDGDPHLYVCVHMFQHTGSFVRAPWVLGQELCLEAGAEVTSSMELFGRVLCQVGQRHPG